VVEGLSCLQSAIAGIEMQRLPAWASAEIFPGGGQSRHFAYPFQVVDDATQIDIHKTKIIPNMSGMSLGYSGDFPN